jgi:chorismate mutase/prephenate dehydrogenase
MNERLDQIRTRLNEIDSQRRRLHAARLALTDEVGHIKLVEGLPARDMDRERAQIATARQEAEELGLPPDFAEADQQLVIDVTVDQHHQKGIQ